MSQELLFRVNVDANGLAKVTKLSKSFQDADKKAMLLGKTMEQNRQDLKRFGLGVTAVAGGIAYFSKKTLDSIDAQTKASRATGLQTELYTGLTHVAELGGVAQEKLNSSMKRFSKNINDASMGIGTGVRAFEQLGIKVEDNNGNLKTQEQLLFEVADKFEDMENGVQKTAIAQDIFGKSGTDLINVLNGGSDAMRAQLKEAEDLGLVFSEEIGAGVERAQDALTKVGASMKGFFIQILSNEELMERFTATFDILTESAKWWIEQATTKEIDEVTESMKVLGSEAEKLNKMKKDFKDSKSGMFSFLMSEEDNKRWEKAIKKQEFVVQGAEAHYKSAVKAKKNLDKLVEPPKIGGSFTPSKVASKSSGGISAEEKARQDASQIEMEMFVKDLEEKKKIEAQYVQDKI